MRKPSTILTKSKTIITLAWLPSIYLKTYLIPIKIRAPLNFAPLIFAHPQISCPFNFCAPLFYCKFAVFSFIRGIFLLPLIFDHSNLLPLIFAQPRCAKIKGARILRYTLLSEIYARGLLKRHAAYNNAWRNQRNLSLLLYTRTAFLRI